MTLPLASARPRMSAFVSEAERSARASKRHSVSKLYSMVHAENDTEVEDELSRSIALYLGIDLTSSAKAVTRFERKDLGSVKEEFRA
jgi:hypothetical protein